MKHGKQINHITLNLLSLASASLFIKEYLLKERTQTFQRVLHNFKLNVPSVRWDRQYRFSHILSEAPFILNNFYFRLRLLPALFIHIPLQISPQIFTKNIQYQLHQAVRRPQVRLQFISIVVSKGSNVQGK